MIRNGIYYLTCSCIEKLIKLLMRRNNMMKRMKKTMRVNSQQELRMQAGKKWQQCKSMLRIVEKYGDRNRLQLMTKMIKVERNGQKGIHRINIFEDVIFNNIYLILFQVGFKLIEFIITNKFITCITYVSRFKNQEL